MLKVIKEMNKKLKVLAMLNKEFFDEVREEIKKKGIDDII